MSDGDRAAYAQSFVAACRRIGLNAVVITDHHDLVFAPIVRRAAAEEVDEQGELYPPAQRLIVFPGVELTLALARQALLILDADFPNDRLRSALRALAITPHDPAAANLPDVKPLDHITSLADLHKKLDERDWLKGRYIVLPNASDSGHKRRSCAKACRLRTRTCPAWAATWTVQSTRSERAINAFPAGEDASWGNKPIAIFQTSDARSEDLASLG